MSLFRNIHTTYWTDTFIMDLEPEEKYFYLYLLTNPMTKACGIYQISKKLMEFETGLSKEKVNTYLKKFIECNKIRYSEEHNELYIINFLKYNSNSSPNTIKCLNKEFNEVKEKNFVKGVIRFLQGASISEQNDNSMIESSSDEASIINQEFCNDNDIEKYKNKEKEKENYNEIDKDIEEVPSSTSIISSINIISSNSLEDPISITSVKPPVISYISPTSKKKSYGCNNNILLTESEYNRAFKEWKEEHISCVLDQLSNKLQEGKYTEPNYWNLISSFKKNYIKNLLIEYEWIKFNNNLYITDNSFEPPYNNKPFTENEILSFIKDNESELIKDMKIKIEE